MSPAKKRKHADDGVRSAKKARTTPRAARHEFAHVDADLAVAVPPVFAAAPAQGVLEMLDSMLMRYIPPLRGVVLAHADLRFLAPTAEIQGDSPFAVCRVAFGATVWSPRVGQRLTGHISLSSPDHVALLVHRTFNAAIPAAHVPRDQWEFVPGPAEDEDVAMDGAEGAAAHATPGHWVHAHTREPLGGPARTLAFTVVGLTIANQMLSVVGSLLPEPFARAAVPAPELEDAPEPAAELEDAAFTALEPTPDASPRKEHKKRRDRDAEKPRKKSRHKEDEGEVPERKKKKKRRKEEP